MHTNTNENEENHLETIQEKQKKNVNTNYYE